MTITKKVLYIFALSAVAFAALVNRLLLIESRAYLATSAIRISLAQVLLNKNRQNEAEEALRSITKDITQYAIYRNIQNVGMRQVVSVICDTDNSVSLPVKEHEEIEEYLERGESVHLAIIEENLAFHLFLKRQPIGRIEIAGHRRDHERERE